VEDLLANLDANYYCKVHVHYGGLQRIALLKAIGEQLGVETTSRAAPLLTKLQRHIATLANGNHPVYPVICVDDAQLVERQSFMDLCSLIICAPKKTVVASIVLAGDELLARQLALAIMTPVRSRMTANFTAEPLGEKETEEFVAFRLQSAKAPEDLFEPDALKLLAANCHGNRRKIMNMATLLLNEAYCREEKTVGAMLLTSSELIG
jgi:general secretion pathway protein A